MMVPLRKSRGGQFLTPLGSPEDMDLEEVRARAQPARDRRVPAVVSPFAPRWALSGPHFCPLSSSRTSPGCSGAACGIRASSRCPGPTSQPASPCCRPPSSLVTRSSMVALTTEAWSRATDMFSLCLLCCRRVSP